MKKAVIILSILLFVGMTGLVPIVSGIVALRDKVEITETVLEGDVSMIEGVTVTVPARWQGYQYWTMEYQAGREPETETDYRFYSNWDSEAEKNDKRVQDFAGIYFLNYTDSIWEVWNDISEKHPELAALEAALEVEGQRKELTLRLAEYLEYYPVSYMMDLPGGMRTVGQGAMTMEEGEQNSRLLEQFFRIPVLEEETMLLTLEKRNHTVWVNSGTILGNEPSFEQETTVAAQQEQDYFYWRISSETDDSAVYFTFWPYSEKGVLMDTSLIPGGFGVYRLPFTVTEKNQSKWNMEELELMYSIPAEKMTEPAYLLRDEHGNLLVFYGTKEGEVFAVVDKETGRETQRFLLEPWDAEPFMLAEVADDFLVYYYGSRYSVIDWTKERGYERQISFEITEDDMLRYHEYREEGLDWDGSRLLYADYIDYRSEGKYLSDVCDFMISVYTETGRVYYATYATSLEAKKEIERMDGASCSPHNYTPIRVQWGK